MNLFITGTDTGVGKTYVSALLVKALRKSGLDAVGMKPICCGDREDAEALCAAGEGVADLNDVNPVWLRTPASPYTASIVEERSIDLTLVREAFARLHARHQAVIVEGVGGWYVPITKDYFVSHLAAEFALPVAIGVGNRRGAINHALLTIEAVRSSGVSCAGLIYNEVAAGPDEQVATATNRSIIETLVDLPVLFEVARHQQELRLGIA